MSDIFDHNFDAMESRYNDGYPSHKKDRMYHHREIIMDIIHRTEKSLLIKWEHYPINVWVPLKICRNIKEGSMFIHGNTFSKILTTSINKNEEK